MKTLNQSGGSNRFKYQSFFDQLKTIDVDVARRVINGTMESRLEPGPKDSYFNCGLTQWKELNCTQDFAEFLKDIVSLVQTFNLVVFYKAEIVGILIKHLRKPHSQAYEPLLSLLVLLAFDLRGDFQEHFANVISCLTDMLRSCRAENNDAHRIKSIFDCLGFLYKYLRKELTLNFGQTFDCVAPLLGESQQYIRSFAAPGLAFLIRSHTNVAFAIDLMLQSCMCKSRQDVNYLEGVAFTLFESIKGPRHTFHSKTREIIQTMLTHVVNLPNSDAMPVIEQTFSMMALHANPGALASFMDFYFNAVKDPLIQSPLHTTAFFELTRVFCVVHKSSKISSSMRLSLLEIIRVALDKFKESIKIDVFLRLLVPLCTKDSSLTKSKVTEILNLIAGLDGDYLYFTAKALLESGYCIFEQVVNPCIINWLKNCLDRNQSLVPALSVMISAVYDCNFAGRYSIGCRLMEQLLQLLTTNNCKSDRRAQKFVLRFMGLCQHDERWHNSFLQCVITILDRVEHDGDPDFVLYSLAVKEYCRYVECNSQNIHAMDGIDQLFRATFRMLTLFPDHPLILDMCGTCWTTPKLTAKLQNSLSSESLESIFPLIMKNISSPIPQNRLSTIKILSSFEQPAHRVSVDNFQQSNNPLCNLFSVLLEIEELPNNIENIRSKIVLLRKLDSLANVKRCIPQIYGQVLPRYCIGLLGSNFQPLWKEAARILFSNRDYSWQIWSETIKTLNAEGKNWAEELFGADPLLCRPQATRLAGNLFVRNSLNHDLLYFDTMVSNAVNNQHNDGDSCLLIGKDLFDNLIKFRLDKSNFFKILMNALKDHALQTAEKNAAFLFAEFVAFYRLEYLAENYSGIPLKSRMVCFLELFAEFRHPAREQNAAELIEIYYELLTRPDEQIQALAFRCLCPKLPFIQPYAQSIERLIGSNTWREELSTFNLSEAAGIVALDDRAGLISVISRIFFGKLTARKDATQSRKSAILAYLASASTAELESFMALVFKPFSRIFDESTNNKYNPELHINRKIECRKQLGFLSMAEMIIGQMGISIEPLSEKFMLVLTHLAADSQRAIDRLDDFPDDQRYQKQIKAIRAASVKLISEIYALNFADCRHLCAFNDDICRYIVTPRLRLFEHENTQSSSGLLELFCSWSAKREYFSVFSHDFGLILLDKIFKCIAAKNVKTDVVNRVLDIAENVIQNRCDDDILPAIFSFLIAAIKRLTQCSVEILRSKIGMRAISIVASITEFSTAESADDMKTLIEIFFTYLKLPDKSAPPSLKGDLLRVMEKSTEWQILTWDINERLQYFRKLAHLFSLVQSSKNRQILVNILTEFAAKQPQLSQLSQLVAALNSMSSIRLGEKDWEQRLDAFNKISDYLARDLTSEEWLVILYNCIFFLNDSEESVIRSNAILIFQKFIEIVAAGQLPEMYSLVNHVVVPGIKSACRSTSEGVRLAALTVLAYVIRLLPDEENFKDMQCLLAGGDEEAEFFANILHVQHHRRTRALHRFSELASKICEKNHCQIFLPIICRNLLAPDTTDSVVKEHQLMNESVAAIGAIAKCISWHSYYELLKKMLVSFGKPMIYNQKVIVKTIVAVLDAFHWDLTNDFNEKIICTVKGKILPELFKPLAKFDEGDSNLPVRIPIALAYARMLTRLPRNILESHLPMLLTTIVQVLRSRSQEVRDITRDTLTKICKIVGYEYLFFVFKELISTLQKGYQLHILGYSVWFLLDYVSKEFPSIIIDQALLLVLPVLVSDIFGLVAEEKDVEQIKISMREAKAKKGFETFKLMAMIGDINTINQFFMALSSLMAEHNSPKFIRDLEEVMRNLGLGIAENTRISFADYNSLSLDIMAGTHKCFKLSLRYQSTELGTSNFIMQPEQRGSPTNFFAVSSHLLNHLGFTLIFYALKNGRFEKSQVEHIEYLRCIACQSVKSIKSAQTKISAISIRIISLILRYPATILTGGMIQNVASECVYFVCNSSRLSDELPKSSLQLISVLLRSVNGQPIKESDVVRLIDIIKANLLSTEVSSAVFSLIKALLSQKYLIPEIYELMDQIGELLVTSHSSNVRELSRQTLLIFLMEYPLTARVLQQRVAFLIKNLSYTHEYGRHSAVTMLHSLIDNFPEETFNQYASLIFVALLVRLDNESPSSVCFVAIESALKALIGGFFDRNAYTKIFTIVKKMFASDMASKIIACHVTGLIFERFLTSEKTDANNGHSETLFDLLLTVLKTSNNHADTTTIIKALESLLVGVENFPSFCDAEEKIYNLLTIVMGVNAGPHSVISCRILFALLSKIADMKISTYNSDLPLIQIAYSAFEAIKANDITETDGLEFIKLLFALFKVAKNHPALFSNEGALDAKPKNHMGWLIQKMSYLARSQQKNHGVILPRSLIYRWFASVIDFLTGEELIGYSMKIMFPMYRTILDTTTVGQGFEDLKLLAQEILLLFEKKIGSPEFVKISSNINRRIEEVRNDRRVQRKQQVVANPQSSAKRKIERNLMKRAGRKRKIDGRRSMRV